MNKVVLVGRLTRDPEVRYGKDNNTDESKAVARYTLAVDRRFKREGEQSADFIPCVAFGKNAEFASKYFFQGTKIGISGHIQTGSYVNRDNIKVYTTDVIIEEQEFAESKKAAEQNGTNGGNNRNNAPEVDAGDGFMNIPDGIDEELPFA